MIEDEDDAACPWCGSPFEDSASHYGLDVRTGKGKAFVTFHPCCESMRDFVSLETYKAAYGRRLVDVVAEITGQEVLRVEEDGDGSVVCRLQVLDPTAAGKRDGSGRAAAKSPSGWRDEVFADVEEHHRHHDKPQGYKFGVAVYNGAVRVGVAVVGRPVSREIQAQEPGTLEVTRVTTWGDAPLRANASSKLYAACAARARALGFTKLITYTLLHEESGGSLVASGWTPTHVQRDRNRSWSSRSRPRATTAPQGPKVRWERGLTTATQRDVTNRRIELRATDDRNPIARRAADLVAERLLASGVPGVSRDELASWLAANRAELHRLAVEEGVVAQLASQASRARGSTGRAVAEDPDDGS